MIINGEETAIFPFDLERFKRVIGAIASGLFYRVEGRPYEGQWTVFSPTLLGTNDLAGIPDNWQQFRELMGRIPFEPVAVPEPSVFRHGVHTFDDGEHFAYAFEFYGGFQVFVWNSE